MAIKLNFTEATGDITGRSKMWGFPDLPYDMEYPEIAFDDDDGMPSTDPMTFLCQIRLSDIAPLDAEGLLPHIGMLYFFADIDYFLGNHDVDSPGMGQWEMPRYRVLYSPTYDNLHTHKVVNSDGTPFGLPAQGITFSICDDKESGFKLLGKPFFDEIEEQYPKCLSLLQVDCDDDCNLQFYDCGMLCFLLRPDDLAAQRWHRTLCYLHSF